MRAERARSGPLTGLRLRSDYLYAGVDGFRMSGPTGETGWDTRYGVMFGAGFTGRAGLAGDRGGRFVLHRGHAHALASGRMSCPTPHDEHVRITSLIDRIAWLRIGCRLSRGNVSRRGQ